MKAITIWQPWASLIAIGAKRFETRGWSTSYRGPIAIHAAMAKPSLAPLVYGMSANFVMTAAKALNIDLGDWMSWAPKFDALPRGCIVATADLVAVWRICYHPGADVDYARKINVGGESMTRDKHHPDFFKVIVPTEQELLFGDWTPGRYAWELANVKMLDKPIPAKGLQRIWSWEGSRCAVAYAGRRGGRSGGCPPGGDANGNWRGL